jgi:hypothetical protein
MAEKHFILELDSNLDNQEKWPSQNQNSFVKGVAKLQKDYKSDPNCTQFKQHMMFDMSAVNIDLENNVEADELPNPLDEILNNTDQA